MLTLLINSLPAVIKDGTSFKLTRENPAFSEQGDYTFEVTLPLRGCPENIAIYGPLHRPETALAPALTSLPFQLLAPLLTLSGTATVTAVTQDEVKVQLLAGRSEANIKTTDADGNDIYIDELPLGKIFDEYDIATLTKGECENITTFESLCKYLFFIGSTTGSGLPSQHGPYTETSATFFPVWSAADKDDTTAQGWQSDLYRNVHEINAITEGEAGDNYHDSYPDGSWRLDPHILVDSCGGDTYNVSPQPRLWECLRRILLSCGFTLKENTDIFLRSVIIVPTARSASYADLLPHWTLSEFLKEFNNFFSTVIVFHEDHTAEVRFRDDFYRSEFQTISEIAEDTDADLSEESASGNASTGNVDYDWQQTDDMLRLPDEVYENVPLTEFASYTELSAAYEALPDTEKKASAFLYRDTATGYVYASLQDASTSLWQLTRIDYYPPLLRDTATRDISTTLKIIPARVATTYNLRYQWNVPVLLSSNIESHGSYSVNTAINTESEAADSDNTTTEKNDFIEVAYAPGTVTATSAYESTAVPIPLGVMVQHNADSNLPEFVPFTDSGTPQSPAAGPFQLHDTTLMHVSTLNEEELITSRVERTFSFLSTAPLDITKTFLIRSRPYLCHKLEYTIQPTRVAPLVTGYFYPLK